MDQEEGFGSQWTGVQFLLLPHSVVHSFIHKHPWSANPVKGTFPALIVSENNRPSFGQAVASWVPTKHVSD